MLGRIVIPKELRKRFFRRATDRLAIEPREDGMHLCPA